VKLFWFIDSVFVVQERFFITALLKSFCNSRELCDFYFIIPDDVNIIS
jgi:hypothetical protein